MTAPDLRDHAGWGRLIEKARRVLERTGGSLDGVITLAAPTQDERLVVIGVTGAHRSANAARLTVRLAELDEHLRAVHGTGLIETVSASAPLRNRPADAKREASARDALVSIANDGRHAGTAWYADWLERMRRDGTMTRIVRAGLPFADLVRVLDALPADGEPVPVFADRVLHDTKALTDGPLRGLLLRAVSGWQGVPQPVGREQERQLLEAVGLVSDDLASQVLVLNVPATGGLVGSWLTEAATAGVPLRVTLHQLRLAPLRLRCEEVYVCENPAVLRAAVTVHAGRSRPLVCTEGVPSAAAHHLLRAMVDGVIRWRNDFDWAGVRMTAAAFDRYPQAVPWRMSVENYDPGPSGPALIGVPAETPWDPRLRTAMVANGRAMMEERLLPALLADLA
ncbi:DUF2399 domain-containing protein [Dactylosporangium roseum]|uniref:DUF2399 domain-containing protein n=1 Tax=Dactylosporangium roseum TaxID=47989 RepID=A0ABY5YX65_9ACTN|nr:TIGR02679 domain-containing protein [Dactylosporangium roseum]UWZ34343.1 DUF2399 domain-containing protein [Dactylosporangium roseum]